MFKDLPVDVGVVYEGERIRSKEMFVEFAGPKSFGAELAQTRRMDEIQDGKITIIGPEITEMKEGGRYPFAILVEVAGEKVEKDLEGILERRIHEFINYVQGAMHLNQRDAIWLRVNKESRKKGLTLNHIGKAITRLFKAEYPFIEKVQVTFITDESKVKEFVKKAREIYGERDARVRGIKEEEVDKFYGCVLCQSFSPSHVCVITPERISLCGAISWLDGRAAARINPEGANFEVEKGNLLDPIRGEYEGVNKVVEKRSGGSVKRFFLHSIFSFPHTSCGCFEAIAFYIPEVDGIGVVTRDFNGLTPFGIPFSTMAGQAGGGVQISGFTGIGTEYFRSKKFFQADGGYNRLVWLPKIFKERIKDAIPPTLYDKIATEETAPDLKALKEFLQKVNHPITERWKEKVPAAVPQMAEVVEAKNEAKASERPEVVAPVALPTAMVPAAGGIKIILKNAKIYAEKVIIVRREEKK
ncbi:MAG: CO dehydrogenase/CO-methylating acetyl-CoA synthase complex subunit beta [Euryarchaeota archaeon]|nr:CO dehydrogenase/CO-methylating acetyl-CoA synthase complex subunit beta [Euryarchaeota archaeon]